MFVNITHICIMIKQNSKREVIMNDKNCPMKYYSVPATDQEKRPVKKKAVPWGHSQLVKAEVLKCNRRHTIPH